MSNIGKWALQTSLDASGVTSGAKTITDTTTKLASHIRDSFTTGAIFNPGAFLGGLTTAFTGQVFTGALRALESFHAHASDAASAQNRLMREFSMGPQAAAGFLHLGEILGVDAGTATHALEGAARHVGDLRSALNRGESGGAAGLALERLNINAQEFVEMPIAQALGLFGDRLRDIANPTERMSLLFGTFGREARNLMPFINEGSAGLASATDRAHALSPGDIAAARAINREMREVRAEWNREIDSLTLKLERGTLAMMGRDPMIRREQERGLELSTQNLRAHAMALAPATLRQRLSNLGLDLSREDHRQIAAQRFGLTNDDFRNLGFAAAGVGKALSPTGPNFEQQAAIREEGDRLETALRRQAQTWGMSADEATRYDFALRGMQPTQLARIQALQDEVREQQLIDSQRARARGLADATRTPLERLRAQMQVFTQAASSGAISQEAANRGIAGLLASLPSLGQAPLLGALAAGSPEVGAILQEAIQPQMNALEEMKAMHESMRQQHDEAQRKRDAALAWLEELYNLWNE